MKLSHLEVGDAQEAMAGLAIFPHGGASLPQPKGEFSVTRKLARGDLEHVLSHLRGKFRSLVQDPTGLEPPSPFFG